MRFAEIDFAAPVSVRDAAGNQYIIGPGITNGVIHIQGFDDVQRNITHDKGYIRLSFGFADKSSIGYVFITLLRAFRFWPDDPIRVWPAVGPFKKDMTVKLLMDTRDSGPIRFTDGREILNRHKYNDVTMLLRAENRSVAVRLTVYIGDLVQGKDDSYLSVDYEVPLTRLLWRNAPSYSDDDIMPEGEQYVDIRPTRTPLMTGITPSPITVIPTQTA